MLHSSLFNSMMPLHRCPCPLSSPTSTFWHRSMLFLLLAPSQPCLAFTQSITIQFSLVSPLLSRLLIAFLIPTITPSILSYLNLCLLSVIHLPPFSSCHSFLYFLFPFCSFTFLSFPCLAVLFSFPYSLLFPLPLHNMPSALSRIE